MNIVSFDLEGDFAAFRDPSVTTNQTICVIPSKSAVMGLIGAIIGVDRSNSLDELYCKDYLNLLKSTLIGIKVRSQPNKFAFFTNHRSLKEKKMKPFKTELLVSPRYTIFVKSIDEIMKTLLDVLESRNFKYSPTLGHSYCLARIPSYKMHQAKAVKPEDMIVSTVILDEVMETVNKYGAFMLQSVGDHTRLVIERHLHHYFEGDKLERRVLRHLIPVPTEGSEPQIGIESIRSPLSLAKFFEIDGLAGKGVCLY